MAVRSIRVQGYRSLVDFQLKLGSITLVTGPNGTGKSNLYRAFKLIHHAAEGEFAKAIAAEGGMPSALWSGKPKSTSKRKEIRLTVNSDPFSYELAAGLPPQTPGDSSLFVRDPDIKEEYIWATRQRKKSTTLMERKTKLVTVVDAEGARRKIDTGLYSNESVLAQLREPREYPDITDFQHRLSCWRFYHQFRTDSDSPIRRPQVGCRTPILHHDGRDLAAAIQTIREHGDDGLLDSVLEEAFPDCQFFISMNEGWFTLTMARAYLGRDLEAHEFSDGTLRFLCLVAALLSPSPPELIILNEPEMSLNPSLITPLARLIIEASQYSQIWVTTHSDLLKNVLNQTGLANCIELTIYQGQTKVKGKETVIFEADDED